jgi:AcrR family transcriptional regulator
VRHVEWALYYYFPDRDAHRRGDLYEVIEKFAAVLERIVASSSSDEEALRSMMKDIFVWPFAMCETFCGRDGFRLAPCGNRYPAPAQETVSPYLADRRR